MKQYGLGCIRQKNVSKERELQKLTNHFDIWKPFSPLKTENEQSLRRCSTKGMEVCFSVVLSDYTCTHVTCVSPYG